MVVGQQASVSALAWLMTCYWIPSLIFAPAIGAWVDRYDRRYVVMITKAMRIVVLLVAAVIYARYPGIPALLVLGFCMGTCAALYTPALLAMVRDLVPAKHLLDANAAVDVAFEIGFIIGMPVSGALLMLAPLPVVLVVTAGLFGLALMCLIGVRLGDDAGISPTRDVTRHAAFVQGLRYLLSHRRLLLMYSVQALMYVTLMTTSILLAPFAKVVLNLSAGEFGAIEAALSLGVVVGALILPAPGATLGLRYGTGHGHVGDDHLFCAVRDGGVLRQCPAPVLPHRGWTGHLAGGDNGCPGADRPRHAGACSSSRKCRLQRVDPGDLSSAGCGSAVHLHPLELRLGHGVLRHGLPDYLLDLFCLAGSSGTS